MIKPHLKVEQLKNGGYVSHMLSKRNEIKCSLILKECLDSETVFTHNIQTIGFIFQKLHEQYPTEPIFEQYDECLKIALPYFKSLSTQFQAISQYVELNSINKIQQVMTLYCSDMYYQLLFNLTLLHSQFEQWGGEYEYKKWVQKSQSFSTEIIEKIHTLYTPMIVIQRLPQLAMIVQELAKHTADSHIRVIESSIKENIERIHEKKRKIAAIADISYLLDQENKEEEEAKENQKKAVQFFVENRLYTDSQSNEIKEKIKKYYAHFFQDILQNLCKQIEELKIKIKKKPSKRLEEFNSELKEKLSRYLEFSNQEYERSLVGGEPWIYLAHAVLAEDPLTYATLKSCIEQQPDNKKLQFMRCFSDFLLFIKEHSDEKMMEENQDVLELLLIEIEKSASL